MKNLPVLSEYVPDDLVSVFAKIHQPRSKFQLEKFVIGAHDTDEMRYVQCVTEIQALYYTIKEVSLSMQITDIEITRLRKTGDEIDELNAQIKELGLEQTKVVGVGAFRELKVLLDLLKTFPAYKREDIEKDQENYWTLRLTRQEQISPNQQAIQQAVSKQGELT